MTTLAAPSGGTLQHSASVGPVLIQADSLIKHYGPIPAVDGLSFEVRRGEILGLLGPNGAGKSTTLRILVGFQYPDSGRVLLNERDVFREGPAARASLGYLPESVPLYAEMEVRAYLDFFARAKRVVRKRTEVDRVVQLLNLGPVLGRPCGNLSHGYHQRVGLAQALLGDPAVLILDEPTSGLDPNQIHDFRTLVRSMGRDRAILLSTHILPEALEVCDQVLILSRGRKVALGRPGELAGGAPMLHWARLRPGAAPTAAEAERFSLQGEGSAGVYRVARELERAEARDLLRLALEKDWEILEWGSGSAGLESAFRRLTLGEEEP